MLRLAPDWSQELRRRHIELSGSPESVRIVPPRPFAGDGSKSCGPQGAEHGGRPSPAPGVDDEQAILTTCRVLGEPIGDHLTALVVVHPPHFRVVVQVVVEVHPVVGVLPEQADRLPCAERSVDPSGVNLAIDPAAGWQFDGSSQNDLGTPNQTFGHSHPLITPTGRSRATFLARPARSTTSTT